MRKIIVFNMVSLDSFFAGPKGEIDWHNTDDEFNKSTSIKVHPSFFEGGRCTHDYLQIKFHSADPLEVFAAPDQDVLWEKSHWHSDRI